MDVTAALAEIEKEINILSDLVEHSGWNMLRDVAEVHQQQRIVGLIGSPLESLDGALAQEFMKGEIAGVATFLSIPETTLEGARAKRDELRARMEDD